MTFYLRDDKDRTIVDCEVYTKTYDNDCGDFVGISSVIDITNYSEFLLSNQDRKEQIVVSIDYLSELRGWLWENYFIVEKNTADKKDDVIEEVRKIFTHFAKELNLNFVTD